MDIPNELYPGFTQSVQAIYGLVDKSGKYRFNPNPFQLIIHTSLMIYSLDTETASLNNPRKNKFPINHIFVWAK
jgi:hypothetical protein